MEIELGRQGRGQAFDPACARLRRRNDHGSDEPEARADRRAGQRSGGGARGPGHEFARGAKDIAALGKVTFESIAGDGRAHTCRIFPNLEYEADDSRRVTPRLLVFRARKQFKSGRDRFRLGGILVKSRHAIHEATLFDRGLEWDSNAQWFHGRLTCEAIDDLWNEYDERQASGAPHPPENPVPILDPSRKSGLTPGHPFVDALYGRALGLLRPLVEEERTRAERERARSVESRKTRKRLDALEKAANRFMEDFSDEDTSRHPKGRQTGSGFQIRGYVLSPQYAQYVRGQSFRCWLTVLAEAFPEIGEGETVHVECLTDDLRADRGEVPLEPLDAQEGVLRATWSVKALEATPATGLAVRVGPIEAESTIAVLASEAERYRDLAGLRFERSRYRVRGGSRRHIRLLAPKELVRSAGTDFALTLSSDDFHVSGTRQLLLKPSLGIAVAKLTVRVLDNDASPSGPTRERSSHSARVRKRPAPP